MRTITTRRRVAALAMAVTTTLAWSTIAVTTADVAGAATSDPPAPVLDHNRHGEDAIRALGDRLPQVAAANGRTPAELRAALRTDPELWVGRTGQLLFVDESLARADAAGASAVAPTEAQYPLSETFALHSRPGAPRVVFLDFDGYDATGSGWDHDGHPMVAAPYDADGDPTTFSDTERATIQDIWRRVAEDYAVFDIDVTTEDPGSDAIGRATSSDQNYGTRLVVTPTNTYGCSCGGVAYVGVFDAIGSNHDYYQPAWVYTFGVGTGSKTIAEAASHEIGHNLGLSHDGTSTSGYYAGQGDWAPIMGVGYYQPLTQWSRGEYADANNPEDDFAVMGSHGATLLADDHGDTPADATALTGPDLDVSGMISTAADRDAFSFSTTGGDVTLHATPATVSPDLDIELRVLDANGSTVAVADPPSSRLSSDLEAGLDAELTLTLAPGTYTAVVDGIGAGDPAGTGYSDYASVGRYRLVGSVPTDGSTPPPPPATPPAAPSDATATAAGTTVTVTWTDNSDDETGFEVVREFLHKNGSWRGATVIATTGADATSVTDDPGSGTFRYSIRAVNDAGASTYTVTDPVAVSGSGSGGGGSGGGGGHGKPKLR